ncbi:barstar family protein [Streptomyces europaeiscabiei]|uniref:barstar family protein n=1 Tax=Streptomyces europaeiscabiei TaxID=146819 RepID=UPI003990B3CA
MDEEPKAGLRREECSHRRGDQRSRWPLHFGRNLDALADCLSGGFGAPDDDDYVAE